MRTGAVHMRVTSEVEPLSPLVYKNIRLVTMISLPFYCFVFLKNAATMIFEDTHIIYRHK